MAALDETCDFNLWFVNFFSFLFDQDDIVQDLSFRSYTYKINVQLLKSSWFATLNITNAVWNIANMMYENGS